MNTRSLLWISLSSGLCACSTSGTSAVPGDGGLSTSGDASDGATAFDSSAAQDSATQDSPGGGPGGDSANVPDGDAQTRDPFFALGIGRQTDPWPTVPFSVLRLWDSGVAWAQLETDAGTYDFTGLDAWLTSAEAHGVDVLYTFGRTPEFASSDPTLSCGEGAGECAAPSDLATDGTGTNAFFKTFVAALVAHVGTRIKYYEVWNEVNNTPFWSGTAAQLVRLAFDLRAAVTSAAVGAKVLTPSTCNCDNFSLSGDHTINPWDGMAFYLATSLPASIGSGTGASLADGVAFHPYLGVAGPEGMVTMTQTMLATMASHGASGLPLWDTESSWGKNEDVAGCPDSGLAPFSATCTANMADFAARSLTLAHCEGASHLSWYQWDNSQWGTLWDPTAGSLPPAQAYARVETWLTGATLSPCAREIVSDAGAGESVWTCALSRGGGYMGEIVWDTRGPSSFHAGAAFTQSESLAGVVTQPLADPVPIGTSPVLLESGAIP